MTVPSSVTRLEAAINSHNAEDVAACFSLDYVSEVPHHPMRNFVGRETVERNWIRILARTPNLRARLLRSAINGVDVWSEWEMEGSTADGSPAVIAGPVIWRTDTDGLVSWARFYLDPVTSNPPLLP
ncbi:nuclear transport factor 2 family protein [Rhodococcus sp. IEGM 1354]|nr:nuclear transport factor 2 family protein [Rhodococcus sp. IEGM 1354]MDI9930753.1 nuclear transport factor 2 family protein [Rhodococcus sp. IEGM 1354]